MSPITTAEASGLILLAVNVLERLEEAEVGERKPSEPLKRGMLTCGEALLIVSSLIAVLAHFYPEAAPNDDVVDLASTHFRGSN